MKRSMIFLCLILAMCYPAYAAAVPDFGGAWTRDVNESDALATLIEGAVTPVNADLVIKHADGKIEVESVWTHKAPTTKTYILNGTENNAADGQGDSGAYVAYWDGEKLIIDEKNEINTPFGRTEIIRRSEWFLSADEATLTILSTNGQLGSSRKQVYHR